MAEGESMEEALRAREAQLRSLGDNIPNGVIYQVVRRADGSNYFPYMSGYSAHPFARSAWLSPGAPLLAKPFAAAGLTDMVRRTLDGG